MDAGMNIVLVTDFVKKKLYFTRYQCKQSYKNVRDIFMKEIDRFFFSKLN